MKKIILLAVLICIMALGMIGCTMAGAELGLVGTWTGSSTVIGVNYNLEITFNSDDTGKLKYTTGSTSTTVNMTVIKSDSALKTISLDFKDTSILNGTYSYVLSGNSLTLKSFSIYGDVKLKKK